MHCLHGLPNCVAARGPAAVQAGNGEHHIPKRSRVLVGCGSTEHLQRRCGQPKAGNAVSLTSAQTQPGDQAEFLDPNAPENPAGCLVHRVYERAGNDVLLDWLSVNPELPTKVRQRTSVEFSDGPLGAGAQDDPHSLKYPIKSSLSYFSARLGSGRRTRGP